MSIVVLIIFGVVVVVALLSLVLLTGSVFRWQWLVTQAQRRPEDLEQPNPRGDL